MAKLRARMRGGVQGLLGKIVIYEPRNPSPESHIQSLFGRQRSAREPGQLGLSLLIQEDLICTSLI